MKFRFLVLAMLVNLPVLGSAQAEDLTYKACDLVDVQTVRWTAMDQELSVKTNVQNADGEMPKTVLSITDKSGNLLFQQKGSHFAEPGELSEDIFNCDYHRFMAAELTIASLKGEELTMFGFDIKSARDLDLVLSQGESCAHKKSEEITLMGRDVSCEWLSFQMDMLGSNADLDNETVRRLLREDAPMIAVNKALLDTNIYLFDAKSNKFVYFGPAPGC